MAFKEEMLQEFKTVGLEGRKASDLFDELKDWMLTADKPDWALPVEDESIEMELGYPPSLCIDSAIEEARRR